MIGNVKQRAARRAKIIEGQFKGLHKAIDNEAYCMDILTQSLAIQRSLASLNKLVLENHLRTCARDQLMSKHQTDQDKAIEELLGLYELSNIRAK